MRSGSAAILDVPATTPAFFQSIYTEAQRDAAMVPWADGRPSPALIAWLNAIAPSLVRCGSRVVVVGCGLGDDARALMNRGYDVTAFDCSEEAVQWARSIDPANVSSYQHVDLFNTPPSWKHRFDLAVEINTLQALTPDLRSQALQSMADLIGPHGYLLVICRGADAPPANEDGPPWPLTSEELMSLARIAHLEPLDAEIPISTFLDDETPPVRRMRAVFRRHR